MRAPFTRDRRCRRLAASGAGCAAYGSGTGGQSKRRRAQPDARSGDVLRAAPRRQPRHAVRHRARLRGHPDAADFPSECRCRSTRRCAPYIDEQRRTGAPALTAEAPLVLCADERHDRQAEVHSRSRRRCSRCNAPSRRCSPICSTARARRRLRERRSGIMGAAVEGHLDSGHVVGSVSGHLYQSLPRSVRSRFVVPPEVSSIADYDLKYLRDPAARADEPGHHLPRIAQPAAHFCGCSTS